MNEPLFYAAALVVVLVPVVALLDALNLLGDFRVLVREIRAAFRARDGFDHHLDDLRRGMNRRVR